MQELCGTIDLSIEECSTLENKLNSVKIQIVCDGSRAATNSTHTSQRVHQEYERSVSNKRTSVVKFLSTAKCPGPVSNLIMMVLENIPRFANLFSAETIPVSKQKTHY